MPRLDKWQKLAIAILNVCTAQPRGIVEIGTQLEAQASELRLTRVHVHDMTRALAAHGALVPMLTGSNEERRLYRANDKNLLALADVWQGNFPPKVY